MNLSVPLVGKSLRNYVAPLNRQMLGVQHVARRKPHVNYLHLHAKVAVPAAVVPVLAARVRLVTKERPKPRTRPKNVLK